MTQHRFYFANQFANRHRALALQKNLQWYYEMELVNPFYDAQRDDIRKFDKAEASGQLLPLRTVEDCRQIMFNDLTMIADLDGIVCVLYDHEVIGSFMEIFYCSYVLKLPVYLICYEKSIREHLWIRALCYKIFDSEEAFKDYVVNNPEEMR